MTRISEVDFSLALQYVLVSFSYGMKVDLPLPSAGFILASTIWPGRKKPTAKAADMFGWFEWENSLSQAM
jgi:hypothetical protein